MANRCSGDSKKVMTETLRNACAWEAVRAKQSSSIYWDQVDSKAVDIRLGRGTVRMGRQRPIYAFAVVLRGRH